jgi:hypothetical protein
VCDFPFEQPMHRAAWLSALLTPFGRHAFEGPAPLHLFDANISGSGKTLLAEIVSLIATGRDVARTANPRNELDCKKLVHALAICGDGLVLIDNIAGQLGCPALDAALTATSWRDRVLGRSQIMTVPLAVTWLATGNNVILRGDTCRRTVHCRLESKDERPEEREDFSHPNLRAHVREHRGELLGAALTILRAYFLAGCPKSKLPPWGSFEGWSDLIRQSIVWLDLPDPGETRDELRSTADEDRRVLTALLSALDAADTHGQGMTTAEIIKAMEHSTCESLRDAVHDLCGTTPEKPPSSRALGSKLSHVRDRNIGGGALGARPGSAGFARWSVVSTARSAGSARVCADKPGDESRER